MTPDPDEAPPSQPAETVRSLLPGGSGSALITVDGGALDHGGLRRAVDRLAAQLMSFGIGRRDRVAIVLPNGPEMALTLLAVWSVGCAAPLNPKYRQEEYRFYLDDLRPRALVTLAGESPPAVSAAGSGVIHIALEGDGLGIGFLAAKATGLDPVPLDGAPRPDDEALVLHTSGTTSRPKIVPLCQHHLARSARNIAASLQLAPSDRSLNVMPLFHIHGIMAGLLAPLSVGGAVIATPGFDAFSFGRWLDDLAPTYYSAVPTMHGLVVTRTKARQSTSLRFVRSSSSALPRSVSDELTARFGVPVIEAYGMTEATHQMTCNPLPPGRPKAGSVGLPTGIEVGILGSEDELLPPGETGEVVIRGATVISGYEANPEANASSFTNGWFRTGDEGYRDEDGYLFLTGRLKEQINRGGEKISPLEVEDVILEHPSVAEALVFAMPDDRLGEEVAAMVVLKAGAVLGEDDVRAYVTGRLAAFKVPRRVLFVDEIPKGATGKPQRIGMAERIGLRSGR